MKKLLVIISVVFIFGASNAFAKEDQKPQKISSYGQNIKQNKDLRNKDLRNKDLRNKDLRNKDLQNRDLQNKDTQH